MVFFKLACLIICNPPTSDFLHGTSLHLDSISWIPGSAFQPQKNVFLLLIIIAFLSYNISSFNCSSVKYSFSFTANSLCSLKQKRKQIKRLSGFPDHVQRQPPHLSAQWWPSGGCPLTPSTPSTEGTDPFSRVCEPPRPGFGSPQRSCWWVWEGPGKLTLRGSQSLQTSQDHLELTQKSS